MIEKRKCFAGANNFCARSVYIVAIKEHIFVYECIQPQTAINSAAKVSKVLWGPAMKSAFESKIHSRTERATMSAA
jgi:hypothetical protein